MYSLNTSSYGSHKRIVSLVRPNSTVLDVGCGDGFLAPLLEEKGCFAFGLDKVITKETKYRAVWRIDIEEKPIPTDYDYIILGDIIEHIREPLEILKSLKRNLHKETRVIISVPNIANIVMRLRLLFGNFNYEERGLLDRTHLRFFTKKTLKYMIWNAGYVIERMEYTPILLLLIWPRMKLLYWILIRLARMLPNLFAYQFVAVVR